MADILAVPNFFKLSPTQDLYVLLPTRRRFASRCWPGINAESRCLLHVARLCYLLTKEGELLLVICLSLAGCELSIGNDVGRLVL
jgi:hypothetical protein